MSERDGKVLPPAAYVESKSDTPIPACAVCGSAPVYRRDATTGESLIMCGRCGYLRSTGWCGKASNPIDIWHEMNPKAEEPYPGEKCPTCGYPTKVIQDDVGSFWVKCGACDWKRIAEPPAWTKAEETLAAAFAREEDRFVRCNLRPEDVENVDEVKARVKEAAKPCLPPGFKVYLADGTSQEVDKIFGSGATEAELMVYNLDTHKVEARCVNLRHNASREDFLIADLPKGQIPTSVEDKPAQKICFLWKLEALEPFLELKRKWFALTSGAAPEVHEHYKALAKAYQDSRVKVGSIECMERAFWDDEDLAEDYSNCHLEAWRDVLTPTSSRIKISRGGPALGCYGSRQEHIGEVSFAVQVGTSK